MTLEQATQICIIVAMCAVIYKAFSRPIENLLNAINPFRYSRQQSNMWKLLDEHSMKLFQDDQEIKELINRVDALEKAKDPTKKD